MAGNSLSICIPTYNFGKFIGKTLESISTQLTSDVEVVVFDGASTDNTSEIVRQYQNKYPNIKYYRAEKKGGIDRDMATSVELASGEYCWLFSADDIMKQDAVATILRHIKQGHDLYLCKHTNCTFDMQYINEHPVLRHNKERTFDLADPLVRKNYFALAQTSEAFFSFMCGIIVKQSKWGAVPISEMFVGSCWGHVARLFELIPKGLTLQYVPEPLLDHRGDNDSFADKGIVNRYGIAIDGYQKLGDVFFGHKSVEAYHIRRVIRNEFSLRTFLYAKWLCWKDPMRENVNVLNNLMWKAYSDPSLSSYIKYLIYTLVPGQLLEIIRKMKKIFVS